MRSDPDSDHASRCSPERSIARGDVGYLVVASGGILGGRRVLVSPISFRHADWSTRRINLALTMDKIRSSPGVDMDKPVSRQHEQEFYRYYAYQPYWGHPGGQGFGPYPTALASAKSGSSEPEGQSECGHCDTHLRSVREVLGYQIQGTDEAIGHVADFVVDDETWEVRCLGVDVRHWWSAQTVPVPPHWANRISWEERKVHLDLSREAIKRSPVWDASAPVNCEYEARLYDYDGRPVYRDDRRASASGGAP